MRRTKREGLSARNSDFEPRTSNFEPHPGFTLLEMLVVLVLLSVLAALAFPAVNRGLATQRLRSDSREIAAVIRWARIKAVREQQIYQVGFEVKANQVDICSADSSYQKVVALSPGISLERAVRLNQRQEQMSDETAYYFFSPNGVSESFEVILRNERGRRYRIVSDGFSRYPRIEETEHGSAE
ncbi:MAG: prepilin-type N-terminal cleavage/methylation domain-containing protein [Acidobacteria bacterium]|nr:prepilin-type N-terminal cleavage/methylation domain-containing protein [Acidobacteriota bacterium]